MADQNYDLIVIGSGPAGQKAAICAAKLRKRVAIIDRTVMLGGVCVHTGTIPSKSVREAIFQLTGIAVRTFYGSNYRGNSDISLQDLAFRVASIITRETDVIHAQLRRNRVAIFQGTAQFADPHTIEVNGTSDKTTLQGENILIACGTRPARSPEIPFDGKRILDTDEFTSISALPRELIVVGAGVVGLEYASFMAAVGAEVTLIDQRPQILDFVDREIVDALSYHLRQMGATFRLGEKVTRVGIDPLRDRVFAELESGKRVQGDVLLYAVGRQANGDRLSIEVGRASNRPSRQGQRECRFSDQRPPYLRCGRRHRLPRAREHLNGARPPRELPHVWSAFRAHARAISLRHLHHS